MSGPERKLWLTSREAAAYVGNKSVRAFYAWRKAHHIFVRNNGTVSRLDLDRELRKPRRKWRMAAASLANLKQRKAVTMTERIDELASAAQRVIEVGKRLVNLAVEYPALDSEARIEGYRAARERLLEEYRAAVFDEAALHAIPRRITELELRAQGYLSPGLTDDEERELEAYHRNQRAESDASADELRARRREIEQLAADNERRRRRNG